MMMEKKRTISLMHLAAVVLCAIIFVCLTNSEIHLFNHRILIATTNDKENSESTTAHNVRSYTQGDIMYSLPQMYRFHPKLFAWDGNEFHVYNIIPHHFEIGPYHHHERGAPRGALHIPTLASALLREFPDRFFLGSPPFQVLITDDDFTRSDCINERGRFCTKRNSMPPIISYGSVMKKSDVLMPSVKSFPNPVYTSRCLYHFLRNKSSNCTWSMKVNKSIPFDKLIDTLIWRGTDFSAFVSDLNEYNLERGALQSFLVLEPDRLKKGTPEDARWLIDSHVHLFTPRWMGVQKTLEERDRLASINYTESPWIDVRFSNGFPNMNNLVHEELLKKGVVIKDKMMSSTEMSAYKYQIDLGGGGGTSWEGTLTKLLMPGLLFHHETPTKDWFYDLMKPWKHFIPVTWNLTSLRAVYDFAQMHQEQARKIAEEATKLGAYLLSEEYMKKLYQELYVDYLGEVVRAFDTQNMSWEDMLELYNTTNVELYETAKCNVTWCSTELGPDEHAVFRVFS